MHVRLFGDSSCTSGKWRSVTAQHLNSDHIGGAGDVKPTLFWLVKERARMLWWYGDSASPQRIKFQKRSMQGHRPGVYAIVFHHMPIIYIYMPLYAFLYINAILFADWNITPPMISHDTMGSVSVWWGEQRKLSTWGTFFCDLSHSRGSEAGQCRSVQPTLSRAWLVPGMIFLAVAVL